jgi:protein-S-isoprenylcysteine O-methyltransferase Ste14
MTLTHQEHPTTRSIPKNRRAGRALFNTLAMALGFAVCVVGPAVTWTDRWAWTLVGAYVVVHVYGTLRIVRFNPDLLVERARRQPQPGQPKADKVLTWAFTVSYTLVIVISSADGSRWHVWSERAGAISWAGLSLFAAGWWLVLRALEINAFAVRVIRHQPERGHRVIDTGVYRVVRHPMYAGLVAVLIGAPLWLGSTLGLLLAAMPIGFLMVRIVVEEQVLCKNVAEYTRYTQRVRSRLIPGVW